MTIQEKLETLMFSECERVLIRKWIKETPSRPRSHLRLQPMHEYPWAYGTQPGREIV